MSVTYGCQNIDKRKWKKCRIKWSTDLTLFNIWTKGIYNIVSCENGQDFVETACVCAAF